MTASKISVKNLAQMSVLSAISIVLVYFVHFPLFPAAPFLEYDPANIPIIIAMLAFGPAAGFTVTVVTSIIQGVTVSSGSGIIGIFMHIAATGSYVLVAGNLHKVIKHKYSIIISLTAGTIAMVCMMIILNIIITPIFMGAPVETVIAMILPVLLPFNLIKAGINSVLAYLIYNYVYKHIV